MFTKKDLPISLVVSIETEVYDNLIDNKDLIKLCQKKFKTEIDDDKLKNYAEFSNITKICYGKVKYNSDKSSYDRFTKVLLQEGDEKKMIQKFIEICHKQVKSEGKIIFSGHNIEKFDIPFLIKRMLINNIKVPSFFDITTMKPWDNNIIDTIKLWDLSSYSSTNLELLHYVLFKEIKHNYGDIQDRLNMVIDVITKLDTLYDV